MTNITLHLLTQISYLSHLQSINSPQCSVTTGATAPPSSHPEVDPLSEEEEEEVISRSHTVPGRIIEPIPQTYILNIKLLK